MIPDATPILEQFIPEAGYELSHLLCFSYSLNPAVASALLVRCLPDLDRDLSEIDSSRLKKDEIRRALRDILPKATFVINGHNSIHGLDRMREFEHLLMDQVEKTGSRRTRGRLMRGSFHPKLLLGIYRSRWREDLPIYAKCYVGSRNFTLDLAQEFGVVLLLVPNSQHATFTSGITSLLEMVSAKEVRRSRAKAHVREIAALLNKEGLGPEKTAGAKEIKFHWQDRFNPKSHLWPELYAHFRNAESIGIVSPWLSEAPCKLVQGLKNCEEVSVWCLQTELNSLGAFEKEKPQRLKLCVGLEGSIYDLATTDANRENEPPLHSKYYLANRGGKQTLFFGSANFTNSGLGPSPAINTEILLQYDLTKPLYTIFGYPFEGENVVPAEIDKEEELHCEWLDALDIEWDEFRKFLRITFPDYTIPMGKWVGLSIDLYRISLPISVSEPGDDVHSDNPVRIANCLPVDGSFQARVKTDVPENIKDVDISSLMLVTLRWGRSKYLQTTKIVPVPERIVNVRRQEKNLPARLTMTLSDYLLTLAELVDGPLTNNGGNGTDDGTGAGTALDNLIGSISLDRFAYRMAIMKESDPGRFRNGLERIQDILKELGRLELGESLTPFQTTQLRNFRDSLSPLLDQLLGNSE